MKFILIAQATPGSEKGVPPDPRLKTAFGELSADLAKKGKLVGTGGLLPTSHGARIRIANGRVTITDGPFAEAKEIIGGYAIVEVNSKEEAIEISKRIWQIYADVLGPSYVAEGEIRQIYEGQDSCGAAQPS